MQTRYLLALHYRRYLLRKLEQKGVVNFVLMILLFVLAIVLALLVFLLLSKLIIILLPAIFAAFLVYVFTKSGFWSLVTFLVVALLVSLLKVFVWI
ncbi:MAG: hypothetical protein DRJ40_04910 [Thermoprotei archaeon]|nr:MAG: hypothetical protein DRJ40_04615 [Thermoprotei archaeon]RLE56740.1 MAG: hypothetical protein DRJ40_04910 [Thermoprotei archaeon]